MLPFAECSGHDPRYFRSELYSDPGIADDRRLYSLEDQFRVAHRGTLALVAFLSLFLATLLMGIFLALRCIRRTGDDRVPVMSRDALLTTDVHPARDVID